MGVIGYFVREIKDRVGGVKIINPTQFKIISQSVKKTDKRDAKTIAKYLSKGLIPEVRMKSKKEAHTLLQKSIADFGIHTQDNKFLI